MTSTKNTLFKIVACFMLFNLSSSYLFSQDFTIKNYDVELAIGKEGYFDIHEKIEVEFHKKRRGIQRFIPKKIKHNSKTIRINLDNVVVRGDKFSLRSNGSNRIIRIGDKDKYIEGFKQYDFSYRIHNAMLFEENHTEFLYNIISNWDVPIEKVSYRITLPSPLEIPFNDFKVITGEDGADERNATIEKEGKLFFGKSLRSLRPDENITVAIKLPLDYILRPTPPPPTVPIYKLDKLWALPLAFLAWFISFFFKSKKEDNDGVVNEHFFPPEGFSPAEVGTYYDGKVHTEDIISLLPYWAERGYISITNNNMVGENNDLYFRKIKALESDSPKYQHTIFNGLFKESNMVMLSELKNEIYKYSHKASREIKSSLEAKDLYDEKHHNLFKSGKLIALFFILLIIGVLLLVFTPYKLTGITTLISGIICFGFHFASPKKSAKGIAIKNHLLGLRQVLENLDAFRTQELIKENPNYFEKLFPFAVAFGLDKSWMDKVKDADLQAPSWYGYEGVNVVTGATSLNTFNSEFSVPEIKSVFTSMPVSSGSSSSGGFSGGSAGGGFGGGGSSW